MRDSVVKPQVELSSPISMAVGLRGNKYSFMSVDIGPEKCKDRLSIFQCALFRRYALSICTWENVHHFQDLAIYQYAVDLLCHLYLFVDR